jgi:hypothetical protein
MLLIKTKTTRFCVVGRERERERERVFIFYFLFFYFMLFLYIFLGEYFLEFSWSKVTYNTRLIFDKNITKMLTLSPLDSLWSQMLFFKL